MKTDDGGLQNQESMAEILARRLRLHGLDQPARASWVCQVATEIGAGRFRAVRWQREVLTLEVANGPLIHQLSQIEPQLQAMIRLRLGWSPSRQFRIRFQLR